MKAERCNMPSSCAFSRDLDRLYYWDSFAVRLSRPELTMQQIYLGIFGYLPRHVKWLFVLRNKIVSAFGIKGPTADQLNGVGLKETYQVGEKILLFTLRAQNRNEIVFGGDDKHLNFRLSVLRVVESGISKVVVTTAIDVHNLFGKLYLLAILPIHKLGARNLMSKAAAAGRI